MTFLQKQQEEKYDDLNVPDNSEPAYAWQTLLYSQVLFGHIPSSLRNQLLSSTEQSPTTTSPPMTMHEIPAPPFLLSSPKRETDEQRSQTKQEISSSNRELPPPAIPAPEKKVESLAVAGTYRGEQSGRKPYNGDSIWRREPIDYYQRLYENHDGLVTRKPHLSWYSPPVTPPLSSTTKQQEKRKHIFVRIVAPSLSSITNGRNEGERSSRTDERSREEIDIARQPKSSSEETVRSERNQTTRNFQIQKKGFPIFLSAITRIQDKLDEYQTQDNHYANRISKYSRIRLCYICIGKSLSGYPL